MNTMIMSALTALGIAGVFGAVQSDPQKAMDECCAKRTEVSSRTKPEKCCEKMKEECCTSASVDDGKNTPKQHQCMMDHRSSGTDRTEKKPAGDSHCGSKDPSSCEHGGHRAACGESHGEGSSCMK